MLRLPESAYLAMIGHALDNTPNECCGLLSGRLNRVSKAYRMANAEADSPTTRYCLDSKEQFQTMKAVEGGGLEVIGCFHSHTHTEGYPSPTDVERAAYPEWWYLIISLKGEVPTVRAYRIVAGAISEEAITLERG
jgi:proteasome lid subunit RPN8/RPN11